MFLRLFLALLCLFPVSAAYAKADCWKEGDIRRVAKGYYREHIFYHNLYTTPELYFKHVKKKKAYKKVLAIGDSWFAYPKYLFFPDFIVGKPSNLLTNLERLSEQHGHPKLPLYILSLSNSGENVANMAGIAGDSVVDRSEAIQQDVNVFETIGKAMRRLHCETGKGFDYVLISGGGNDLLSNTRLNDLFNHEICKNPSDPIQCCRKSPIDPKKDQLDEYLDGVKKAYECLVRYIVVQNPNAKIITHTYDRFVPSPVGATFAGGVTRGKGGWLYPVLMTYNITDSDAQQRFARHVLERFKQTLEEVQAEYPDHFFVVDTQGSMEDLSKETGIPKCKYWLNEIHLTPDGYDYVAARLFNTMRTQADLGTIELRPPHR